nr:hypothetical protein [Tanacetum cinerariifolium]
MVDQVWRVLTAGSEAFRISQSYSAPTRIMSTMRDGACHFTKTMRSGDHHQSRICGIKWGLEDVVRFPEFFDIHVFVKEKGRYMKTSRKSIGVKIKEEAEFIEGKVEFALALQIPIS